MSDSLGIALVLVDVQYDFLEPSGSLAVPQSRSILAPIQRLLSSDEWDTVVATQDFHPSDHLSFVDNHDGAEAFKEIKVPHPVHEGEQLTQMMWPRHCVQGTEGAEIESGIKDRLRDLRRGRLGEEVILLRKGTDPKVDGYSGLADNAYSKFTPLIRHLSSRGMSGHRKEADVVVVVGLATDYCVASTAMDLLKFGLSVLMPLDCVAGVSESGTTPALKRLEAAGARLFSTEAEVLEAVRKIRQGDAASVLGQRDDGQGWLKRLQEEQKSIWAA